MKFEVIMQCCGCRQFTRHVVRSKLDAGIFIQLQIACQFCGDHEINWYHKDTYQKLFLNKIRRDNGKKKT